MKIGVIKEIKDKENRVSVTPAGAQALIKLGHEVVVERGAGMGSGFSDSEYQQIGANIVSTEVAWSVELVVKVKEPLESENRFLKRQMIFTFFHLAGADKSLTEVMLENGTTAIAYETLEDERGELSILAPMSAIAGNMATLMGSYYLAKFNHGNGMQLGKVLGKQYGKVVIIGHGVVGQHAAHVASSMGAAVFFAGRDEVRGKKIIASVLPDCHFFISNVDNITKHIVDADLVIGAVLLRGAKAPHVISDEMVKQMTNGAVIVDVSIDQGGCIETSRPTTHSDPVFMKHNVLHYCVANMPGAYPRTSTMALMEATLPYLIRLANNGLDSFLADRGLSQAVNIFKGYVTSKPVATALDMEAKYLDIKQLI